MSAFLKERDSAAIQVPCNYLSKAKFNADVVSVLQLV